LALSEAKPNDGTSMLTLAPITKAEAEKYLSQFSQYTGGFDLAICARDEAMVHGVIVLKADGEQFSLGHISTDGNAHVGSLLYGAAWRVAKALGYQAVNI
jgi:hypothetical protein